MTRDNIWWTISLCGAIIVAVTANFKEFPWIPESYQHVLSLISFIYSIVAAKMGNSPLKGENK